MSPFYVYICEECEHEGEIFSTPSNAPKKSTCPECNNKSFIRCIGTGASFIFKGDGFYCNRGKDK